MKDNLNIPPARDLPPGHRRQRREHLLSELSRPEHERRRRPKVLLAVTAGVVVLVVAMVGVSPDGVGGVKIRQRILLKGPPAGISAIQRTWWPHRTWSCWEP